ncbi:MAG: hypothetical protein AVDCRST_MAG03-3108 [uncultured Rubrobacteraceae bacterium]|uniref:Uncharacterized protein n=1 Tax=uncultured Rubrobacteraceae bacterium TaxID=349277 RepID=A0A6J4PYD4_9ACTN|nr:MAG: hypothetical protein AVDCRST_MAG03-3108 [uncultured Rubrobacteraceae bacterium]
MAEDRPVHLHLTVEEADALHTALESLLETGAAPATLERPHRLLAWRALAARDGTGLTARLSAIAREAETLEEFEAARDDELGPILDGLESAENRDP